MTLRLAALAAAVLLSACGLNSTFNVPNDVRALAAVDVAVEVSWRVQIASEGLLGPDPYERGGVAVDAHHRRVVATTSVGDILAVDAITGDELWRVSTNGEPFSAPPTIVDGTVYAAAPDGAVYALRLDSGGEIWRAMLDDVFHSAPSVGTDRVYVNSATGTLWALNRATGRQAWSLERRSPSALSIAGGGSPLVAGDVVYAGFPDGSLAAVGRDGRAAWIADLAAGEERLRDVDTTPILANGFVYAGSFAGGMHRLDARNGDVIWRSDVRGPTSPVAVGETLVTSTADGRVVWLDPNDGAELAELRLDGDDAGAMVRWGDYLLMSESHDGLYIVSAHRPWVHARFFPDSGFSNAVAAGGSRVWGLSNGGYLYGLRIVSVGASQ